MGEQSQSGSEDKEDGLFTATDVIKQEIKKLESRLSDMDLLSDAAKIEPPTTEDLIDFEDKIKEAKEQLQGNN